MGPLDKCLKDLAVQHVALLTDEFLSDLPLHAACFTKDGYLHTIQEHYSVSYLSSARQAIHLAERTRGALPNRALVIGDPEMDLPFAAIEAACIAKALGTAPLLGTQARKAALADAPPVAVVHFAGHAHADPVSPTAWLRMTDGSFGPDNALAGITLSRGGLCFLSGCQTGGSALVPFVKCTFGTLADAWIASGADYVVATDWLVPDAGSLLISHLFYQYYLRGIPAPEAMRLAVVVFLQADDETRDDWLERISINISLKSPVEPSTMRGAEVLSSALLPYWSGFRVYGL